MRNWTIHIYPSSMAKYDPYFHGQDGVGGITGMYQVKLYVEDEKTKADDIFLRVFRRNALMISHELCHAVLIQDGRSERVPLRHDDYSGHRAGAKLAFSTAEVHDRHTEKKFYVLLFNFWDWRRFTNRKMQAQVLDFRPYFSLHNFGKSGS